MSDEIDKSKMTGEEKDFLLAEFNNAWGMIRDIDNRRGDFLKYYTGIVTATLAIPVGIIATGKAHDFLVCIGSTILLGFVAWAGQTIRYVLKSEREANIRYRKKLNLIRELFILDSTSSAVLAFQGNAKHRQEPRNPAAVGPTSAERTGRNASKYLHTHFLAARVGRPNLACFVGFLVLECAASSVFRVTSKRPNV